MEEVPRGVQGSSGVEDSSMKVTEETRCETGEGDLGVSGRRVYVSVGEVVCCGGGGFVTGRRGNGGIGELHVGAKRR